MDASLTAGLKRGGGVRSFLASRERFLTTLLWMAQLTQQCSFTYSLGKTYAVEGQRNKLDKCFNKPVGSPSQRSPVSYSQSNTLASEMSLTAAASTIFLMTNFLMALSLGTHRAQFVQRMGWTCPRPFLARPLFLLFLVQEMEK